jgi:carboxypeptidase C (cathepsin A)
VVNLSAVSCILVVTFSVSYPLHHTIIHQATIIMKAITTFSAGILLLAGLSVNAQVNKESTAKETIQQDSTLDFKTPQQSVTYNTVTAGGTRINYKAIAGTLVLKNNAGIPVASIFYSAYFKEGEKDASQRPVTFLYNGGPGISTIWLHMGAFGPQRVYLDDTSRTKAPYKTVNNEYSLLDASDLVFIDAPGTGFSKNKITGV